MENLRKMWYNSFVNTGKQVQILYEPVAVRRKKVDFYPFRPHKKGTNAIGGDSEKAEVHAPSRNTRLTEKSF